MKINKKCIPTYMILVDENRREDTWNVDYYIEGECDYEVEQWAIYHYNRMDAIKDLKKREKLHKGSKHFSLVKITHSPLVVVGNKKKAA